MVKVKYESKAERRWQVLDSLGDEILFVSVDDDDEVCSIKPAYAGYLFLDPPEAQALRDILMQAYPPQEDVAES